MLGRGRAYAAHGSRPCLGLGAARGDRVAGARRWHGGQPNWLQQPCEKLLTGLAGGPGAACVCVAGSEQAKLALQAQTCTRWQEGAADGMGGISAQVLNVSIKQQG